MLKKLAVIIFSVLTSAFASASPIYQSSCDNTPGLADSYTLAVSWEPAFCETYYDAKEIYECQHLAPDTHDENYFSLHGLWPNQAACGIAYGNCDPAHPSQSQFCDYPALDLSEDASSALRNAMPGYNASSCLERHEWYKHGSCQITAANDPSTYFIIASKLLEDINSNTDFSTFIQQNKGKSVEKTAFTAELDKDFGAIADSKIKLICSEIDQTGQYDLTGLYISLPKLDLSHPQPSLHSLMLDAPNSTAGNCPDSFLISNYLGKQL